MTATKIERMQGTIREYTRLVFVEVYPEIIKDFGDTVAAVHSFLEGAGFEVELIGDRNDEYFVKDIKGGAGE